MRSLLAVLLSLAALSAHSAERYVRQGATGDGSGTSWTNAYSSLPNTLVRGDTYYVADGSYSSYVFDDPASGSTPITIKKCTPAQHGTETGYSAAYCDGQASIGEWTLGADFLVIDGSKRNESNWADGAAYGFRVNGGIIGSTAVTSGVCASNITVKYVNIGGPESGNTYTGNEADYSFKIAGFTEICTNWTLSRNYSHNTHIDYHINGADGGTIEYSYIRHGFGKESIRGQIRMSNYTIRHNVFKDSCQGNPGDPTGGACTAPIALFDGSSWANTKIYGNVFYYTNNSSVQDAILAVGGLEDPPVSGVEIYNNTFAGFKQGNLSILVRGSGTCRNNLSYDMVRAPAYSCSTQNNNASAAQNPFVGYTSGDFRLSRATGAGAVLPAPYNVDALGNTRGADGTWDLGALEFGGTQVPIPNPPTALQAN